MSRTVKRFWLVIRWTVLYPDITETVHWALENNFLSFPLLHTHTHIHAPLWAVPQTLGATLASGCRCPAYFCTTPEPTFTSSAVQTKRANSNTTGSQQERSPFWLFRQKVISVSPLGHIMNIHPLWPFRHNLFIYLLKAERASTTWS